MIALPNPFVDSPSLEKVGEAMTERAQRIVDATMELTLRPQQGDRAKVIAAAIRAVADCFEYDSYGLAWLNADDFNELANELEAL